MMIIIIPKEGRDIGLTTIVTDNILITITITFAKNHHDHHQKRHDHHYYNEYPDHHDHCNTQRGTGYWADNHSDAC